MRFLYGFLITFAGYAATTLLATFAMSALASSAPGNSAFGFAMPIFGLVIIAAGLIMFVCTVLCWIGLELVAIRKRLESGNVSMEGGSGAEATTLLTEPR